MNKTYLMLCGALLMLGQSAWANVKIAGIFGHNMVLQRSAEIPVWGWAEKGEKVTLEFQGISKTVAADENGKWITKIGPFPAGGPFEMKITGTNTITINNIMIGEVWVCSGQSNMQWPLSSMEDSTNEIAQANYPDMRLVTVCGPTALEPQNDLSTAWISCRWGQCSSNTARDFSAPGYFFGRELYKKLNVPIGLIATPEGSSPIRAWISPKTQQASPLFKSILEDYKTYAERKKVYDEKRKAYDEALKKSKAEGTKELPFPGYFEAYADGPGMLYNTRIYPLAPFAIKGVIWWQGGNEAIFKHAEMYKDLFPVLIKDWRDLWQQGDFPFLIVQLAPINAPANAPVESDWAEVREGQRRTLKVKNTGMVVTTDICESALHPIKKVEVGKRLALAARAIAYGEKLEYSGPIFDKAEFKDGKATVSFTHVGSGLAAKGDKLEGFSIAGPDKQFVWADAGIKGDTVVVSSAKVPDPKTVRYAWADNPSGNLFNKEGLPASCFRSDD